MRRSLPAVLASCLFLSFASVALANDVDGLDCGRVVIDYGDAPEGLPFRSPYGIVTTHYPTCLAPTPPGTQEAICAPRSTAPGPTGYMRNFNTFPSHYWLGCFDLPNIGLTGIDDDVDGKVGPPGGPSACSGGPTDGDVTFVLNTYAQDESYSDGDAGLYPNQLVSPCNTPAVPLRFQTANCGNETTAYLNVLIDLNFDGDWNDNVSCDGTTSGCVHEWAVKNVPITIGFGCQDHFTPPISGGPLWGTTWLRITLTDGPVDDDFPWAGSANRPDGQYAGGETEDYPIQILAGDPVKPTSWGHVKTLYR